MEVLDFSRTNKAPSLLYPSHHLHLPHQENFGSSTNIESQKKRGQLAFFSLSSGMQEKIIDIMGRPAVNPLAHVQQVSLSWISVVEPCVMGWTCQRRRGSAKDSWRCGSEWDTRFKPLQKGSHKRHLVKNLQDFFFLNYSTG